MEAIDLTKLAIRAAREKQRTCRAEKEATEQALEKLICQLDEAGAEATRLEAKLSKLINAPPSDGTDVTGSLSDDLLLLVLWLLGPASLLVAVPAVCKKWRRLARVMSGARLDLSFVPCAARKAMSADRTLQMATSLAGRFPRTTTVRMYEFSQLEDGAVIALANNCSQLTAVKFGSCRNLTDVAVVALANNCPHLTTVSFNECDNLTDVAVVALANNCPQLTAVHFDDCDRLTKVAHSVLAKCNGEEEDESEEDDDEYYDEDNEDEG